ncbi:MAG: hypothetical protein WCW31_02405 [Patescibacteria group bacterium]|jgi:hypothetical protein
MNKIAIWIVIIGATVLLAAGGIWYLRNRTTINIPLLRPTSYVPRPTYDPPSKFKVFGATNFNATSSENPETIMTTLPDNLR